MNKKITMTDADEWDFESKPFVSLAIDGRGVLDGHATVRAVNENGVIALFQCPGKGCSPHCFSRADEAARSAGFQPIGNFYERKVRGQPWMSRL